MNISIYKYIYNVFVYIYICVCMCVHESVRKYRRNRTEDLNQQKNVFSQQDMSLVYICNYVLVFYQSYSWAVVIE